MKDPIQIILDLRFGKQKFVIPSPEGGETENDYISRCISKINGEYPEPGQAYAICKGKWDEK